MQKIKKIEQTLWNKLSVTFEANPDVNIIVGNNGSGKTTLLNKICDTIGTNIQDKDLLVFVPSVDNITTRDKRRNTTALAQDFDYYLHDTKIGPSLTQYRMKMIDASAAEIIMIKSRTNLLLDAVNRLLSVTDKTIIIKENKYILKHKDEELPLDVLSSGEKQVLLLLLRIFLTEDKEAFVLIDEPETSLDVEWQFELINIFQRLNPNAQYFIATHSPGIFGDGWGDKVIYMDQVSHSI